LTGQITTEQIMVVSPDGRSASSSTAKPHIQDLRCVGDQPRRPSAAIQEYLMTDTAWDDPHRNGAVPSTAARYVSPASIDPLGLRARLMLETSSHLMAEPNWPYRQTTVEMRSQGNEEGIFRLFGANHPDSIRRVTKRQLDISIMNPSAILFCEGMEARKSAIPWHIGPARQQDLPLVRMVTESAETPMDVPLHPAAQEVWTRLGYLNGS
jgi:hypothetical protein